ncbi:prephenate dehydrogenase [Coprinopsis cinerea okayama7|uniref:Prephenate dehydrogenase n=1 Tax=Coprinopsis cinerea (strain Okayama-7 / 130 / ATCC MYA-4618 / FGSC 9003) TaxID=240176 RepID=D6RN89_COPC7|nr:prephenate dehydrogenase [Coprinopsis cinerea okayama7\|eukprot:XP_002910967.1 prephenate dehydrogenase [Coprinopsis cinerea okayama7\
MNLPINVSPTVSASSPKHEQPTIGLIGMGAMGRMYAKYLAEAGWQKIHVCDLPERFEKLKEDYAGTPNIHPMRDGHAVSRSSDFIVYSVEAEYIDRVVAEYGPSTKMNAIVAGQTSVKAPERQAFEAHLPQDVHIVSCHSLHGPGVSPVGQPLVLIKHRGTDDALTLVESILSPLKSRFVYLSYEEHDSVTANTQAVTHAAFLSMGTAWACSQSYPWEQGLYVGGIETVKVNLTLRIFSNAWHVYAGLAILNPSARVQIDQYAKSTSDLFKLMLKGGAGSQSAVKEFRERIQWARETVFGEWTAANNTPGKRKSRRPILLSASILDRFSLGISNSTGSPTDTDATLTPPSKYRPNSHLSLLAMVDCWAHLGINPYHHLSVAATPLFRLFLGVAEHLFLSTSLLNSAMDSALHHNWHRSDDLEFVVAARGWSQCVSFGSFDLYRRRFEETRTFFEARFDEAGKLGSEMIKAVMESEMEREESEQEV